MPEPVFLRGHAEVSALLRNVGQVTTAEQAIQCGQPAPLLPLELDAPGNRAYRRMLDDVIAAGFGALASETVRHLAAGALDGLGTDPAEIIDRFAQRFSTRTFLTIMGLPLSDEMLVGELQASIFVLDGLPDVEAERSDAGRKVTEYFESVIDRSAAIPPGIIRLLTEAEVDGRRLDRAEVLSTCYLLLLAGIRTVADALSVVLPYLVEHPRTWDEMVTAPERTQRRAIDELLRWGSPVPGLSRVITGDLEIGDVALVAGSRVVCLLPEANHDPAVFERPAEVDLARSPNPHLTFGGGAHRCLGATVAYSEIAIAVAVLHDHLKAQEEPFMPDPKVEEDLPMPGPTTSDAADGLPVDAAGSSTAAVLNRSGGTKGAGLRQSLVARLLTWNEAMMDRAMPKPSGALSVADFPWMRDLERNWEAIAEELDGLIAAGVAFPEVSDVAGFDQGNEGSWSTYSLFTYGTWLPRHTARCPVTTGLVRGVPGLQIAGFSVLGPGAHLPRHRGPNRGALRYQIGLRMTGDPGASRLQVGDELIPWSEGASLVFDHSVEHEAWNDSDGSRYLLFIEFVWPRAGRVGWVNRAVQHLFGRAARPLAARVTELDTELNPTDTTGA